LPACLANHPPPFGGDARRPEIPSSTEAAGMMFSVIVKQQRFTKHIQCQCAANIFLTDEVIAAVQPISNRHSAIPERRAEA
jgi:hypothetical protein